MLALLNIEKTIFFFFFSLYTFPPSASCKCRFHRSHVILTCILDSAFKTKYVSEAIMVPEELWIGFFSNLVVKYDTSPFITGLICPLGLGFKGALRRMHRTIQLITAMSQCWSAHLLQPGCLDRTLQDAELPAAHPKPDRDMGLQQNHPGPQIFLGAETLCLGSKAWLTRAAVEPWCTKGRNPNPAEGPAQGCSHAMVNPLRSIVNPTAVFPVQQLATGVTGGYYWHVPSFCNAWEHSLLLPALLPEEEPFPIADFQSLYAFTEVLHNGGGLNFPCLQCFSVSVNNWPFQAHPWKTEHSGFCNDGKTVHH